MNSLAVSAPYSASRLSGSTPLFFDLDIFSTLPTITGCPSDRAVAPIARPRLSRLTFKSLG